MGVTQVDVGFAGVCAGLPDGGGPRAAGAPLSEWPVLPGVAFSPAGLPPPPASERRDPDPRRMQVPPGNPLLLSHTLQELLARDSVQVELIPEKKGLFLKHVEYEVSSQVPAGRAGGRPGLGLGKGPGMAGSQAAPGPCRGESLRPFLFWLILT